MYKSKLGYSPLLSLLCLVFVVSPTSAQVNPESVIQILQRLDAVENKSRELTGENEVLRNEIEQLKKNQKQGFLNIDKQIETIRQNRIEKQEKPPQSSTTVVDDSRSAVVASAQVKVEAGKPPAPSSEAISTSVTEGTNGKIRAPTAYEKETYQAAFDKMEASPSAATRAFQEYIKLQPESPLAANAQYWIGEIMYSHNNYKGAVQEFIKVLQQYKGSNKAPDAAIKLGYSFYALKNWPYARRTFEDVLKYFPENKNAVSLATKRLEQMAAAGN